MNAKDLTNRKLITKARQTVNMYGFFIPDTHIEYVRELADRYEALLPVRVASEIPVTDADFVVPVCLKCGVDLPDAKLSVCNTCFREGNAFVYPPCHKCGRSLDELEPDGICIECEADKCPVGCDTPCENCPHPTTGHADSTS